MTTTTNPTPTQGELLDQHVEQLLQRLVETPAGERIRMQCGAADLRSVITDLIGTRAAATGPRGDERIRSPEEKEFLAASVAVWREIDRLSALPEGYQGLPQSTDPRKRELAAWEAYRTTLDTAATSSPAPAESDPVVLDEHLIALCDEHARIESAAYVYGCALLGAAERAGLVANGVNSTNRGRQQKQFIGEVIKRHLSLEQIDPPESDASWEATLAEYRQQINAMESGIAAPPDTTRVAGEQAKNAAREILDNIAVSDFREMQNLCRLDRIAAIISKHFAAAPNDNDAESLLKLGDQKGRERVIKALRQSRATTTKGDR